MSLVADLDITPIAYERGMLAIAGLAEFFRDWIAECRTGSRPMDNLIDMPIEAGDRLSAEELLANCILMFTVGHSSDREFNRYRCTEPAATSRAVTPPRGRPLPDRNGGS